VQWKEEFSKRKKQDRRVGEFGQKKWEMDSPQIVYLRNGGRDSRKGKKKIEECKKRKWEKIEVEVRIL